LTKLRRTKQSAPVLGATFYIGLHRAPIFICSLCSRVHAIQRIQC